MQRNMRKQRHCWLQAIMTAQSRHLRDWETIRMLSREKPTAKLNCFWRRETRRERLFRLARALVIKTRGNGAWLCGIL